MKYINKNTGETISAETYSMLSSVAQSNFIPTHQEKQADHLSIGDGIAICALLPFVALKSIF